MANINKKKDGLKSIDVVYICTTYHHVYVSLIKTLLSGKRADIILGDDIPENEKLMCSLINCRKFVNVYHVDWRSVRIYTNKKSYLLCKLMEHQRNKSSFEKIFKLDLHRYQEVYIFHDGTKLGKYLQDIKIKYRLIEDAVDSYKQISKAPDKYLLPPKSKLILFLKKYLRIGYLAFGQNKYCLSIEVNDKNGIEIPGKKIVVCSKKELIAQLSEHDKMIIYNVFTHAYGEPILKRKKGVLILTQPLFGDHLLKSKKAQIDVYRDLINIYKKKGFEVYIKPHPRDNVDYQCLESTAWIWEKNIPAEVYNFNPKIHINIAVSVFSTAVYTIDYAKKKVLLGHEYLKKYKNL